MRNLYIHIGQPKTGSSTIQKFLVDNRDGLLAAGLGIGPYMTRSDGKGLPMHRAIQAHGLESVMEQFAASPGEHLVISSEHLFDLLTDAPQAEAFRDAARRHFNPVVVVFLRRQDYWHESLYAQEVKTCYAGSIDDFARDYSYDYDYDRGIAGLERIFGRDNVRVGLLRDTGTGAILEDFLAAVDIAFDQPPARTKPQNASPHRRKILFLSLVPKPDPKVQTLAEFMTQVVEKTGAIAADGTRFLLPPPTRHRLVTQYLAGNRALVERYRLADAEHFASPPEPDPGWSPPHRSPAASGARC